MHAYMIRQIAEKEYEIASFDNDREPTAVYQVKVRGDWYACNCPGFYRQHDKERHKHSKLVRFWRENLEEGEGYALWLEEEDVEYHRMFTLKDLETVYEV